MSGTRTPQTIARGGSMNDSRRDQAFNQTTDVLAATTISFTAGATIADSANGMARIRIGDRIRIFGSALNSRVWLVTAAAVGSLTVLPAMVQTEAAGAAIRIERV